MEIVDLGSAADRMAGLIRRVPDGALDAPTPCSGHSLGDLLGHVAGFTLAFTAAATKTPLAGAPDNVSGDARRLGDDWRTRIPSTLDALVTAWRDPAARSGMTRAGGIEMSGEVAAVVALEELVVHGWDVASATGQAYDCDERALEVIEGFLGQFAHHAESRGEAYAAPVDVPDTASRLERVVALSGRDPTWPRR